MKGGVFDRTGILAVGRGLSAEGADVHDGTNRIVMPGPLDALQRRIRTR